ncbi:hypothetical protein OG897_40635 [Streptomyces sp. NBC_00237]|uniref:hypothetical protein n=1 Tax=Streptomyces sp. NBC_00237 TaxID=2975687 RepID=UPI00224DBEE9|nr:hypothetical protein [Streptomyces sp. NBC_00237]MCX5207692.1 hypothetical protein [Streptomyces sp. NBC_00237]
MTRPRRLAAVVLVLALTGCTPALTSTDDAATRHENPTAAAENTAARYLAAALAGDWTTACALTSAPRLADCHTRHLTPTATPRADPEPTPSRVPLLIYADGRTVYSSPRPTPTRPDTRPRTGPVRPDPGRPTVPVPGTSRHASGWAVLLTHTSQWPGRPQRTVRTALRLVPEVGQWRVDQRADVSDTDLTVPFPAAAALAGGPR